MVLKKNPQIDYSDLLDANDLDLDLDSYSDETSILNCKSVRNDSHSSSSCVENNKGYID